MQRKRSHFLDLQNVPGKTLQYTDTCWHIMQKPMGSPHIRPQGMLNTWTCHEAYLQNLIKNKQAKRAFHKHAMD